MLQASREEAVHYPCSDGEPMADNTKQYEWIVTIRENLDTLLPGAFVGADNFWYPIEGDNRTRRAPDVYVALGRPKGHRSAYLQWKEDGVAPQVVFEIWSPRNTFAEHVQKLRWDERFGVQEYYTWDPDRLDLSAWHRDAEGRLEPVAIVDGLRSALLGITFHILPDGDLEIHYPDGGRFLTWAEHYHKCQSMADEAQAKAEARVAQAQAKADEAQAKAEAAEAHAAALAEKLRALGLDPDAL
ncbi:MAG: Uma2 family endonuclease [Alphaproteobacteria bacterium]|nr:Uma2 family endonuclease [Alphaproteobacteria bacterium]